jgi:hypothetical protein
MVKPLVENAMKVIDIPSNPTSGPIVFNPSGFKTHLMFQVGDDYETTYRTTVFHKLPFKKYDLKALYLARITTIHGRTHVKTLMDAVKIGMSCQRYIMVIDALGAKGVKHVLPKYFIHGCLAIQGLSPSLDHQFLLKMGNKQWIILDSPYTRIAETHAIPSGWKQVWLSQDSDPYYPGNTWGRLTMRDDALLDLNYIVENVGDMNFVNPDDVVNPACFSTEPRV